MSPSFTHNRFRFVVVWLLFPLLVFSQKPSATCHDPDFHKQVYRQLKFDVPTLDVDSLYVAYERYLVLDAREWDEYAVSHLPGALYTGFNHFSEDILCGVSKDTPIAVYCSIGYRSEKIAHQIIKMGYTRVYNVYGSIFEWCNRGYPVEDISGAEVRKVHTYNRKWSRWILNQHVQKVW